MGGGVIGHDPAMMRLMPMLLLAALAGAGCSPVGVAVGAGATAGIAVAQERSVGDAISDLSIKTELNALMIGRDPTLFSDVSLDVIEGRVLMTGDVKTPDDRVEAVKLAWQIEGVKEVINELQVTDRGGIANYLQDAWISTRLRSNLTFDREIAAINYNIETVNGVVYLIGIAQNQPELDRVLAHARTISHVEKVVSHVRLKGANPP
ncbi:MAG: BON domain-containing protein [Alphaproteobacteria bacterium]|nr:BON domain-containing protein [Alphaproteobacteria bacterium]